MTGAAMTSRQGATGHLSRLPCRLGVALAPASPAGVEGACRAISGPTNRPRARLVEPERSQTNERVGSSVYRPFCDDNVLFLVALTS